MHLYLSAHSPWNANYSNEAGQVLYKVDSGGPKIGARRMMISKTEPSNYNPHRQAVAMGEADFKDKFEEIGQVEYHNFRTSHIKYGGQDQPTSKFFSKTGWAFFGRNRTFTGSDGKEYCWKLSARVCKLFINGTETPVAVYHRPKLGLVKDGHHGSLEIFPAGEHMVDLILVTFVYVERLRKAKERAYMSSAGGAAGS